MLTLVARRVEFLRLSSRRSTSARRRRVRGGLVRRGGLGPGPSSRRSTSARRWRAPRGWTRPPRAPPAPFQSSIHFCAEVARASGVDSSAEGAPGALPVVDPLLRIRRVGVRVGRAGGGRLGRRLLLLLVVVATASGVGGEEPPRSATAARAPELPLSSFFAAFFAAGFAAGLAAGFAAGFAAGADLDADALTAGAVVVLPSVRFLSASASVPAKRDFCSRARAPTCLYMEGGGVHGEGVVGAGEEEREGDGAGGGDVRGLGFRGGGHLDGSEEGARTRAGCRVSRRAGKVVTADRSSDWMTNARPTEWDVWGQLAMSFIRAVVTRGAPVGVDLGSRGAPCTRRRCGAGGGRSGGERGVGSARVRRGGAARGRWVACAKKKIGSLPAHPGWTAGTARGGGDAEGPSARVPQARRCVGKVEARARERWGRAGRSRVRPGLPRDLIR